MQKMPPSKNESAVGDDISKHAWKYLNGDGVPVNYPEAIHLFEQAIKLGNSGAMCGRALMYLYGVGGPTNYPEAIRLFEQAIALGDAEAMSCRAGMYKAGQGGPINYPEAIRLYNQAIELGRTSAMNIRAIMHLNGEGGPVNYPEAIRLLEQAIKLGDAVAMVNRAHMYLNNQGGPINYPEAIRLFDRAIALGNTDAMHDRASMHRAGQGGQVNYTEAIRLLNQAIALGHIPSLSGRAYMHKYGEGGDVDLASATLLLYQAFKIGHDEEALLYLKEIASENNFLPAQALLFKIYFLGENILSDKNEAMTWFNLNPVELLECLCDEIIESLDREGTLSDRALAFHKFIISNSSKHTSSITGKVTFIGAKAALLAGDEFIALYIYENALPYNFTFSGQDLFLFARAQLRRSVTIQNVNLKQSYRDNAYGTLYHAHLLNVPDAYSMLVQNLRQDDQKRLEEQALILPRNQENLQQQEKRLIAELMTRLQRKEHSQLYRQVIEQRTQLYVSKTSNKQHLEEGRQSSSAPSEISSHVFVSHENPKEITQDSNSKDTKKEQNNLSYTSIIILSKNDRPHNLFQNLCDVATSLLKLEPFSGNNIKLSYVFDRADPSHFIMVFSGLLIADLPSISHAVTLCMHNHNVLHNFRVASIKTSDGRRFSNVGYSIPSASVPNVQANLRVTEQIRRILQKYSLQLEINPQLSITKAFHLAAANNQKSDLELLLPLVDINAQDNETKLTALHMAVIRGHIEITSILIQAFADVSICDGKEKSALDYAFENPVLQLRNNLVLAITQLFSVKIVEFMKMIKFYDRPGNDLAYIQLANRIYISINILSKMAEHATRLQYLLKHKITFCIKSDAAKYGDATRGVRASFNYLDNNICIFFNEAKEINKDELMRDLGHELAHAYKHHLQRTRHKLEANDQSELGSLKNILKTWVYFHSHIILAV